MRPQHTRGGRRRRAISSPPRRALGYKPWERVGSTSLDDYHQACVRAIRADYCGDGRSFTVNGTRINIYDSLGVQADTEAWAFEARWMPSGAQCVDSPRLGDGAIETADCVAARVDDQCGAHKGGLLRTEAVPPQ